MNISAYDTIGEIVAQDHRSTDVFQTFGIDFQSGGNRSILDVCESRDLDPAILIEDLEIAMQEVGTQALKNHSPN